MAKSRLLSRLDLEVEQTHDHPHHGELQAAAARKRQQGVEDRATERPDPGSATGTAASRDDTNDLLVGDVLRTNQLQERR